MENFKLIDARDSVYAINSYQAINGLQRFQYRYTGREQDHDEIGNPLHVDTSIEPETSGSFEVTDTGSLAALLARMRFRSATQDYEAGSTAALSSNVATIDENDMANMHFDLVEMKRPGSTFSEAKLFPNCYLTRVNMRLSADAVGTASFDWMGNLMIPVYKPYQKLQSFPAAFTDTNSATVAAAWSCDSTTYGLLGASVNGVRIPESEIAWDGVATNQVNFTTAGLVLAATDRIMIWAFALTPGDLVAIDYTSGINFVKPDRINIWLLPTATATSDANAMLRVQSFDVSIDAPRDELKQIKKNESETATFTWAPRLPLNITGSISILETTLHTWATLQGKTLNESATSGSVDDNNILDITSFDDAKVVVEWYKYGVSSPVQKLTLGTVKIVGYEGSMAVQGRKEAVWSFKSNGDLEIAGYDV